MLGWTYNFKNGAANYQNGVDMHLDWGASQFLSKQLHIGLVGYFYNQISPDIGSGATLGSFESRVGGIGPQIGFIFPIGGSAQGYINVKGYKEFAAQTGQRVGMPGSHCRSHRRRLAPLPNSRCCFPPVVSDLGETDK